MTEKKTKIIFDVDKKLRKDIESSAKEMGLPISKYLISLHKSAKQKSKNLTNILFGEDNEE